MQRVTFHKILIIYFALEKSILLFVISKPSARVPFASTGRMSRDLYARARVYMCVCVCFLG